MILTPDGAEAHEIRLDGRANDAESIGRRAGETLRTEAGDRFFEGWS